MLNSNMSITHEFDVPETTAQEITEPGLPNRDHILAQPFAEKIDWAFFDGQKGLDRE